MSVCALMHDHHFKRCAASRTIEVVGSPLPNANNILFVKTTQAMVNTCNETEKNLKECFVLDSRCVKRCVFGKLLFPVIAGAIGHSVHRPGQPSLVYCLKEDTKCVLLNGVTCVQCN